MWPRQPRFESGCGHIFDSVDIFLRFLSRLQDVQKKTDELYSRDERLLELERRYHNLGDWLFHEYGHIENLLQHRHSKKQHVLQNSAQLRAFAKTLEGMRDCIGSAHGGADNRGGLVAPGRKSLDLLSNSLAGDLEARIKKVQRQNEPLVLAVEELYESIANLTEEYERAMLGVSKKLLALAG